MTSTWINGNALRGFFVIFCLLISIGCFAQFGYIKGKAYLAQVLLNQAWQKTQTQYQKNNTNNDLLVNKPWSWADVYPVAKLTINRRNLSYLVLNNDSGQALAFGPGLTNMKSGSINQSNTTKIISGHRDSHFEFLADVVIGDELILELQSGQVTHFIIHNLSVIDIRINQLYLSDSEEHQLLGLVLLTCYPFNSANASTPFRLVVEAKQIQFH